MLFDCAENLVLIGFMGAGKSTVGRLLAKETGRYFLDADALIESAQGRPIPSIFKENGETFFRSLEKESAEWLARCVRGSVISTGGGMPAVVERLHAMGRVIYLQLPFEEIVARLGPEERAKRPLFQNPDKARALYETRCALYERQADIILDARMSPHAIVEAVLRQLD